MKVVIAGGGTAGHVNPAIAVARALEIADLVFVGTSQGAEARLVPEAGFPLEQIDVRGFDRSRPLSIAGAGARAAGAVREARGLLSRHRPAVVLGMGGYVSLPVCLAAWTLRIPIVLHEQNAVLGLSNRISKPMARRVAVSFQETMETAGKKAVFTGNPVLPEVASFDVAGERRVAVDRHRLDPARKTLLVFGGSQGANRINEAAAGLARVWHERADLQVFHIAGAAHAARIAALVELPGTRLIYRVVGYVERMAEPYAIADLAVCRGGASTVAEICVAGIPAVVIPYPHHRDRQQELHGRALERAGAGVVLADRDTTTDRLQTEAERLLEDDDLRESMRKAALALGRPDAAERVGHVLEEVAG
jgi:UDP-N-acetylglucosamine--N-acetylmuramyl-(pentapeptide) pyrophosphoryl-undecaprenol N-acetylglucosamine transferase